MAGQVSPGRARRTNVFAGLGSLHPTERNEMERSGRKLMSPASGADETVPIRGVSGVVRCLHLSATKHKRRLGESGLPRRTFNQIGSCLDRNE
jgi:hypothetical protein